MRIAILGATGFVGRRLTRKLVSLGHEITGYVVNPSNVETDGVTYKSISSFDDPSFLNYSHYDVAINLAARRSTRLKTLNATEVRKFTFEIPKQFFLKTAGPGTLAINTSTYIQNFEGFEGKTTDDYSAAKQELSEFLKKISGKFDFHTLDLFLFTLYGEGDRPSHLVPSLLDATKKGEKILLSPGLQLMNLLHISDAIDNISKCFNIKRDFSYQKYHLWEENYFSVKHLVSTIEKVTGVPLDCVWGARDYMGHEMMQIWQLPTTILPGFQVNIPLEEGIRGLWLELLKD